MLGQKKDDYLSSLNKARKRRRRGFDWKFASVVAGAVVLLAGAAWGGCSLIYNGDIAERLCTPSELKKTRNGERRPNDREMWLDTQTRALRQAWFQIMRAAEGKSLLV